MLDDKLPVIFVGHGAAGLTLDTHDAANRWMSGFGAQLRSWQPQAIALVSAHFLSNPIAVTTAERPPTIHDHPAREWYAWSYGAAGAPELARYAVERLRAHGIAAGEHPRRGLDHGAWIPASLMIPDGSIPVFQVSLHAGMDAAAHVAMGAALGELRGRGVLILASGSITHNQDEFRRGYFAQQPPDSAPSWSRDFDELVAAIMTEHTGTERTERLLQAMAHPTFGQAHPTVDHYLPLLVAAAAADRSPATRLFRSFQHGLSMSAYLMAEG